MLPNIGDKVYLIHIGYVTVKDVRKNGDITVNPHGKESRVPTSHYRTMDRMQPYFDRGYVIEDYTD